MSRSDHPSLGIALRLFSGLLMGGMYVSIKAVSDTIPPGEIVFFRSFFAIIPLLIFLWIRNELPGGLATKRPGAHLIRSSFGTLALFGSFAAIERLNLAEAILILQLSPILMAIAAVVLFSERMNRRRVIGLCLGFAGVLVLVGPELGTHNSDGKRFTGHLIGLTAAALSAIALVMVCDLNKTESPGAIALYFVLTSMFGSLVTMHLGWTMPDGQTLLFLIAAGLFGGFGHIAMTLAFRYAEASRLAAFEYVALLWPLLADLFIFKLPLSMAFILAAPLILAGALFAARERN